MKIELSDSEVGIVYDALCRYYGALSKREQELQKKSGGNPTGETEEILEWLKESMEGTEKIKKPLHKFLIETARTKRIQHDA